MFCRIILILTEIIKKSSWIFIDCLNNKCQLITYQVYIENFNKGFDNIIEVLIGSSVPSNGRNFSGTLIQT